MSGRAAPRRVAILAFDDVEALDLAGPYEVFTTATRMHARREPSAPAPFTVYCVGRTGAGLWARAGLRIVPEACFADAAPPDVLIVPGGVVDAAMACPETLAWVARAAAGARVTASVCTGAFILAAAGVLAGGPATTHWEDVDDLRARFPGLDVRTGVRWVDNAPGADGPGGALFTSAGISAGIDLSLHLVERLTDRALAERTARQMDTPWNPDPHTAPQTLPPHPAQAPARMPAR
ncbi:DJ-1/PfpI family protein [Paracidovorax anthurii]|uniref:DJ-1/PfpI family protein n=1 Tax=Paracidovorax anthurii TaxID=78229 RepID=A0A328Z0R2_9BURK|nr:DJ-1/PfpI family protein [Paracidovorax anthurii]RAR78685.1 DJ-1/PfpI family protein [Paracidovorax anthurii]